MIVPFSDPYNARPYASILKLLKEDNIFAITQHLATRSLQVKKLCVSNTLDLKAVSFFINDILNLWLSLQRTNLNRELG